MGLAAGDLADEGAREAFALFYMRHAGWLYRELCKRHVGKLVDWEAGIEDAVTDTFQRAFKGAATYKRPADVTDPDSLRRLARGWLGQIGNRVIADMLRAPSNDLYLAPDELQRKQLDIEEGALNLEDDDDEEESPMVTALREELRQLSPMKQDVMAAVELYFEPGKGAARMPRGAAKTLAEKWGTTPENIRKTRQRTIDELRKKLEPFLETE